VVVPDARGAFRPLKAGADVGHVAEKRVDGEVTGSAEVSDQGVGHSMSALLSNTPRNFLSRVWSPSLVKKRMTLRCWPQVAVSVVVIRLFFPCSCVPVFYHRGPKLHGNVRRAAPWGKQSCKDARG
jgi:hypothetical protein